jgi:hypothetical protein
MRHRSIHLILLLLALTTVISLTACTGKPAIQWSKTFSGGGANSVQQTTDGGYILCGSTEPPPLSASGVSSIWLIKTDASGNKLWDKTFHGKDETFGWDRGFSVQQTTDGGYMIGGSTEYSGTSEADIWLIKTDANGNKTWDKTFGDSEGGFGCSVQQTTDGGYIICGTTKYHDYGDGATDILLIKTDADGNKLWDKAFGGGGKSHDIGSSVQQTTDGGYIICGSTNLYRTDTGIWLIKTDANGNKMWDKTFKSGHEVYQSSAQQTTDGGYIICGGIYCYRTSEMDIWLIKTDADGNRLWDRTFSGGFGISAQQTTDGGYIVSGCNYCGMETYCLSKVSLIKTDANGNKLWDKRFGGKGLAVGGAVQQTADGGYVVCASTTWYLEFGNNVLLLKIAPER